MAEMFVCDDCKQSFHIDEAGKGFECVGPRSSDGWWFNTCPHCGCSEILEAEECDNCHEWFADTDDGFCDKCKTEVFNKFCEVTKELTQRQRDFIYENLDWDDWCEAGPSGDEK